MLSHLSCVVRAYSIVLRKRPFHYRVTTTDSKQTYGPRIEAIITNRNIQQHSNTSQKEHYEGSCGRFAIVSASRVRNERSSYKAN